MAFNPSRSLTLLWLISSCATAFTTTFIHHEQQQQHQWRRHIGSSSSSGLVLFAGEGGDAEWAKALFESSGAAVGNFEKDMKLKGLMKGNAQTNPKISQNRNLVEWLTSEGDVYLSDQSSWGDAPHPLAISTETRDEITNESSGRGLLARREISDGDELIRIPIKLCMTKAAARQALGREVIAPGMNEYLAIALHLIHERYNTKDKSFWQPYLDILPETSDVNPTFLWSDADLAYLAGSPVVAATISLQRKLEREYDDLLTNNLMVKYPDRFPPDAFSLDHWKWAFCILFSRAIRLRSLVQGERLALVPYADLINHSPFSQAYIDARQSGDWLFKTGEEEVILYADRAYRRMDQVYISYGPKSNADLLLLYGFAVERNPFNSVDVTVSISRRTVNEDPLLNEKLEFLEGVGRENTVDFPCYADRYPIEMLEYLRLMVMTPEDTGGRPIADFDYSRPISTANEASVLNSVVDAVRQQLRKYPQTEEEDAAIIKDKNLFRLLSYNQRSAVRHRRNEKRLLKRTIAALEKQIRQQGLEDAASLVRAQGSTLGQSLPGDKRKQKTALEDRLEKLGLPVDLK